MAEATLNGTLVDDGGFACDCGFEWGETVAYGNTTPTQSRNTGETFSQVIIGLPHNTTYHFRAFATNLLGTSYGADRSFATLIVIPTVSGRPATNIELTTATINGYLDGDGGEACDCGFEWGDTLALGNTTPTQSRTTGQMFSRGLSHLATHRLYYFRPFATNSAGTGYGSIISFDTKGSATVITRPATDIVSRGATINGVVADDGGIMGDVRFQWGLMADYGNETRWKSGYSTGDSFNEELSNLAEGNGYHFKAQFRNKGGIVSGNDMVFNTPIPLGPVTLVTDEIVQLLLEAV